MHDRITQDLGLQNVLHGGCPLPDLYGNSVADGDPFRNRLLKNATCCDAARDLLPFRGSAGIVVHILGLKYPSVSELRVLM